MKSREAAEVAVNRADEELRVEVSSAARLQEALLLLVPTPAQFRARRLALRRRMA